MSNKGVSLEESSIKILAEGVTLSGDLSLPADASGIVLFAHGSGSSRLSQRNRHVARILQDVGLGTLLFDLLSSEEEAEDVRSGRLRFDIRLLSRRLVEATDWVKQNPETGHLQIGYFGASTGAAAALVAAVERGDIVRAIVSRGGRPDLAGPALYRVKAPTLLIVGGRDYTVITLNQEAFEKLAGEKELVTVRGANHLFEEPGALDEVARLAANWFLKYLE